MVITYKDIQKITFPVFLLGSSDWYYKDGLLFCDGLIVDDTNQTGKTLGSRRAQTPHKDLYSLRRMVSSHNGILKQKQKNFIDSLGKPFYYEKTRFTSLRYLKIKRVERKGIASLVWVKGCNSPFTVPRPPSDGYNWAGILHIHEYPWILYEYSQTKLKDTKKKV